MKALFGAMIAIMFLGGTAQAQEGLLGLGAKQQMKSKSRWTLANWMATKQQMNLMDLWLALNTESPLFEFYFGGGVSRYDRTSLDDPSLDKTSQESWHARAGAYVWILGASVDHETLPNEEEVQNGSVKLRLLGGSYQSTHLTAHYGWRSGRSPVTDSEFENGYWGGELALYLVDQLGIQGLYREILKDEDAEGHAQTGTRWEAGAFLELQFLRLYGNYFEEELTLTKTDATEITTLREGVEGGLLFFF